MTSAAACPEIIQGGMGIGVSNWLLAKAVAERGQLGVVSGTAIDTVFVRRLQDGDKEGHMRRAMAHFPLQEVCAEVLKKYFIEGGREPSESYKLLPMYQRVTSKFREQITMLASFVEVFLAKESHPGLVGMNLLTKIQLPTLSTLYGAMLAGVDYILMGAGIPKDIPGILDKFRSHQKAELKLDVVGDSKGEPESFEFDPADHIPNPTSDLKRPQFLAIVSSNALATMLAKKASGKVDGFIVESPKAGGHNAPPRESGKFNELGEPLYGPRDEVDMAKLREVGLPFWLAGERGGPEQLVNAKASGAVGVQVGTLFAFARESGIRDSLKRQVLRGISSGSLKVKTDGRASPTGFPFKVVGLDDTLSEDPVYEHRERICDLGYLRVAYRKDEDGIGFRCSGEPVADFVKKGGEAGESVGRKCLCNSLLSTIGLAQVRDDYEEAPLVTSGDQLQELSSVLTPGIEEYTAGEVVDFLLGKRAKI